MSGFFQSRTNGERAPVRQGESRHVDGIAESVFGKLRAADVVDRAAAIGAEDVECRHLLAEAGLRVRLNDVREPGIQRRDHRAVDGQNLVDPDRAVGQSGNLQRARHAADARAVDLVSGDDVFESVTSWRAKQAFSA